MAKRFYQFNKQAQSEDLTKRGGSKLINTTGETSSKEDEIVNLAEVSSAASDFYAKNQKLILGVLAGLFLIIGGFLAYKYLYQAPREKKAIEAMWRAENLFAQDSFAISLENMKGGYDGFLDIIENYSGTKTANTAKYYAGISYLNLGKYDLAIEYLEDYSPKDNLTPAMKFGALGDAYAETKEMDKAISNYEKAVSSTDNEAIAPYFLNKLAMLQFKEGKLDNASSTMKKIVDEFPTSSQVTDAEKLIARIEVQK
jgi:TolA-binding protein